MLLSSLVVGLVSGPGRAAAIPIEPDACRYAAAPAWFHGWVVRSIALSRDLPAEWARSPYLAKIACWQQTSFRTDFRARAAGRTWHGIFAMTVPEVQTILGQWMTANRHAAHLSPSCFLSGWASCPHAVLNTRVVQQIVAGLRWIWLNYGSPAAAWAFIQRTGRFTSYPRRGTSALPTRAPFRLCPVAGPVHYRDDFGEVRTVGGYHPHWGNDIEAPMGRAVRAPFDGLAVGHSDNWFGGHWVTLVGADGYVRNGHLSRFAARGYVRAGTVIGFVGSTGDARGPHDHFEWHPWTIPIPGHRAPSGFSLIMDGVDPFPFLNTVCHPSAARVMTSSVHPKGD